MSATLPAVRRLVLRPGTPVVRRDAATLQVGLTAPGVTRLPDTPEVRALIGALEIGADPGPLTGAAAGSLALLRSAGLAIEAGDGRLTDEALRVARAQFGDDAVRRLEARSAHGVGVRADPSARRRVVDALAVAGLAVDDEAPAVWLVVTAGPTLRESIDPLQRSGVPHLVVAGDGSGRRLGPFVEPGRTACLRCVDAHEAEADPRRPFLVEQAASASDGSEPVDPVLDRLALAWAARDLARYLEGDEPSTWSTTVDLGPTAAPVVTRWLRHPHCGCAWDVVMDLP